MPYEERWKIEKLLGKGGQGEVHLVQEIGLDQGAIIKNLFEQLAIAQKGVAYEGERQRAQEETADLLVRLISTRSNPRRGALKVLHHNENARDPKRARERAAREIEAMRTWNHPNLLALQDDDGDELWYVSQYHENGAIDGHLTDYQGNLLRVLNCVRPLVEGVALLHTNGVVHRDIKPQNIFLSETNELILGDFGLVYVTNPDETRLSATHSNVGTHAWMPAWAMEQRVDEITPAFDVFSLGKVIWSMLSGKPALPLWYHRREDSDLQRLFADQSEMALANNLLDQCIVEHEKDCLADARDLANAIEDTLRELCRTQPDLVVGDNYCGMCRIGRYVTLIRGQELDAVSRTGTDSKHALRAYCCNYCGHVAQFCYHHIESGTSGLTVQTAEFVTLHPEFDSLDGELEKVIEEFPVVWSHEIANGNIRSSTARDVLQSFDNRIKVLQQANDDFLPQHAATDLNDARRFLDTVRVAFYNEQPDQGDAFIEKLQGVRRRLRIHSRFHAAQVATIPPPPG